MKIICVINGKNERMGELFKTPKHLLLYKGIPALYAAVGYFNSLFPESEIIIMAGNQYAEKITHTRLIVLPETKHIIEALLKTQLARDCFKKDSKN